MRHAFACAFALIDATAVLSLGQRGRSDAMQAVRQDVEMADEVVACP
jgi:hypothetical protein